MSEKERNKQQEFKKVVRTFYRTYGRTNLPWRQTTNPYRIIVSELMLQQTQALRVIPKYKSFLKKFPTVHALAKAPLAAVLIEWSGLGYNRRAKYLHLLAKKIVDTHKGIFPRTFDELTKLPGIGPYTAGAVMAFAYNKPHPLIETNIRTAYIDYFFQNTKKKVSDKELYSLVESTIDTKNPKEWYSALMDYGAALKQKGNTTHRKSAGYKKQSTFKGSRRQVRGMILRMLGGVPKTAQALSKESEKDVVMSVLGDLLQEGMITKNGRSYALAGSGRMKR